MGDKKGVELIRTEQSSGISVTIGNATLKP